MPEWLIKGPLSDAWHRSHVSDRERQKLRVLHLIHSMPIAGAESVLANLLICLNDCEPDLHVELATLKGNGHFSELVAAAEIPVHTLDMAGIYDIRVLPKLIRLVSEGNYDIVHVHLAFPSYCAALASYWVRKSCWVFTEHSERNRRRDWWFFRPIDSAVYSRFIAVNACSRAVRQSLEQWVPSVAPKMVTIPNGVPIPRLVEKGAVDGQRGLTRLLFAGRLEHVKGVDLLIEAVSRLQFFDFELKIAGYGTQQDYLEELVETYGVQDKVEFVGARDDLDDFMRWADVMVMPSRFEGLPMVLLEAMSFELPVVATRVGGIPEVIENGVNGWLVDPENVDCLTAQLQQLLENPQLLFGIGERARQRIQSEYSITLMMERHTALYRRLSA